MPGIVININPVILAIGPFELRWYSLAIMLAIVIGVMVAVREAARKELPTGEIYSLLPWVLVSGIIGARLFHVVDQWSYYAGHPALILQIQLGGLAIWGALAGGGLAAIIYAIVRHIPVWRLADILVPGIIVAQIIGRFGCIINGDAAGGITSLPWAFTYVHPDAMIAGNLYGLPTHPYPVYEMLWNSLVLLLLVRIRPALARDGLFTLGYLALYSAGRFALSFVRQENTFFWGLQQSQIVALAIFLVSVVVFIYWQRQGQQGIDAERVSLR